MREFLRQRGKLAEGGDNPADLAADGDCQPNWIFGLLGWLGRKHFVRVEDHKYMDGQTGIFRKGSGHTYRNTGPHGHRKDDDIHWK